MTCVILLSCIKLLTNQRCNCDSVKLQEEPSNIYRYTYGTYFIALKLGSHLLHRVGSCPSEVVQSRVSEYSVLGDDVLPLHGDVEGE